MKRLLIAALALALAACTGGNLAFTGPAAVAGAAEAASLPAPGAVADETTVDEQALLRLELAYKAVRTAVEAAVDVGVISGPVAARIAVADNKAFHWLSLARSAYDTGNAASYRNALTQAEAAIGAIWGDR